MIIRCETDNEHKEIYKLVKIAFETAQVSDGNEQNFVDELRSSDKYIPELTLVAEDNGQLFGHIMLSKFNIIGRDCKYETLLLAPISVMLEERNKGLGGKLVREVFERAIKFGYYSVILVGNPEYYCRFGFKPTELLGIINTNCIPSEYVMACELLPGSLDAVEGYISF